MSFDSFFFLIKSAVSGLFRNILLTLASVTVLVICLVTLGSSLLVVENVNIFIDEIGDKSQIVIFLDESLTEEQTEAFQINLRAISNIKNIRFEPKEVSIVKFKESLGENKIFFNDIDADTLRDSVIFEIIDLSKFEQTLYEVNKLEGIGTIRERKDLIDRILEIREVITYLSLWIVVLFLLVSVFIIINSVKLSVFARRLELSIMKYVGATDFFIQLPYFFEGIFIGLSAGIIGIGVQIYVYDFVISPILNDLGFFSPVALYRYFNYLLWFFIGGGAAVGILGSVIPVKKYLKV